MMQVVSGTGVTAPPAPGRRIVLKFIMIDNCYRKVFGRSFCKAAQTWEKEKKHSKGNSAKLSRVLNSREKKNAFLLSLFCSWWKLLKIGPETILSEYTTPYINIHRWSHSPIYCVVMHSVLLFAYSIFCSLNPLYIPLDFTQMRRQVVSRVSEL